MATTSNLNTATTPPIINMRLKIKTNGKLIRKPAPPIDQALEYKATTVINRVQTIIYIRSPY